KQYFAELPKPLYTCESAVSEACYLFRPSAKGRQQVIGLLTAEFIKIDFSLADNVGRIAELMKKYADVPMSLADACLVRMNELAKDSSIFTFDGDFRIYRRRGRERIPLIGLDTQ